MEYNLLPTSKELDPDNPCQAAHVGHSRVRKAEAIATELYRTVLGQNLTPERIAAITPDDMARAARSVGVNGPNSQDSVEGIRAVLTAFAGIYQSGVRESVPPSSQPSAATAATSSAPTAGSDTIGVRVSDPSGAVISVFITPASRAR
ncbi:hypothetical protein AB0N09_27920 [Streptomyces erythrochromogenes]|uniref:hypothetical protein n=1 Tax=Streptomyces erythrochromogenes TaxID=285574 RepID=UPI0034484CC2